MTLKTLRRTCHDFGLGVYSCAHAIRKCAGNTYSWRRAQAGGRDPPMAARHANRTVPRSSDRCSLRRAKNIRHQRRDRVSENPPRILPCVAAADCGFGRSSQETWHGLTEPSGVRLRFKHAIASTFCEGQENSQGELPERRKLRRHSREKNKIIKISRPDARYVMATVVLQWESESMNTTMMSATPGREADLQRRHEAGLLPLRSDSWYSAPRVVRSEPIVMVSRERGEPVCCDDDCEE